MSDGRWQTKPPKLNHPDDRLWVSYYPFDDRPILGLAELEHMSNCVRYWSIPVTPPRPPRRATPSAEKRGAKP